MFGHHQLSAQERQLTVVIPVAVMPKWLCKPLGAWLYRAFCQSSCYAKESENVAYNLMERLQTMGVTTLEELKHQIGQAAGNVGSSALETNKVLSSAAVARLLRTWGFRKPPQSRKRRRLSASGVPAAEFGDLHYWSVPRHLRSLVGAANELHAAPSAEDLVKQLSTETADEVALRNLEVQLAMQVTALVDLRKDAINCYMEGSHSQHEAYDEFCEHESNEVSTKLVHENIDPSWASEDNLCQSAQFLPASQQNLLQKPLSACSPPTKKSWKLKKRPRQRKLQVDAIPDPSGIYETDACTQAH